MAPQFSGGLWHTQGGSACHHVEPDVYDLTTVGYRRLRTASTTYYNLKIYLVSNIIDNVSSFEIL